MMVPVRDGRALGFAVSSGAAASGAADGGPPGLGPGGPCQVGREERGTCATRYPELMLCGDLPPEYRFNTRDAALRELKRYHGNPHLRYGARRRTDVGPCIARGLDRRPGAGSRSPPIDHDMRLLRGPPNGAHPARKVQGVLLSRLDHIRELVRTRARNREGLLSYQEVQRELERRPIAPVLAMMVERLTQLAPMFLGGDEDREFAEGVLAGRHMPVPEGHLPLPGAGAFQNALIDLMIARDPDAHYAQFAIAPPEIRSALDFLLSAIVWSVGAERKRAWGLAHPERWRAYHEASVRYIDAVNEALEADENIDSIDRSHQDLMRGWYDDPVVVEAERAGWDDILDRLEALDSPKA